MIAFVHCILESEVRADIPGFMSDIPSFPALQRKPPQGLALNPGRSGMHEVITWPL